MTKMEEYKYENLRFWCWRSINLEIYIYIYMILFVTYYILCALYFITWDIKYINVCMYNICNIYVFAIYKYIQCIFYTCSVPDPQANRKTKKEIFYFLRSVIFFSNLHTEVI